MLRSPKAVQTQSFPRLLVSRARLQAGCDSPSPSAGRTWASPGLSPCLSFEPCGPGPGQPGPTDHYPKPAPIDQDPRQPAIMSLWTSFTRHFGALSGPAFTQLLPPVVPNHPFLPNLYLRPRGNNQKNSALRGCVYRRYLCI